MASLESTVWWIISITGLKISLAADCLYYYRYYYYDTTYKLRRHVYTSDYLYCYTSCCGTPSSQHCCYDYSQVYYVNVGSIVGIVIGSLIGLGFFITLIICLCTQCCRTRPATGQVLRTNNTYINTTTSQGVHTITSTGMLPMQPYTEVHNQGYSMAAAGVYNATSAPPPSYESCLRKTSAPVGEGFYPANTGGEFSSDFDGRGGGFGGDAAGGGGAGVRGGGDRGGGGC